MTASGPFPEGQIIMRSLYGSVSRLRFVPAVLAAALVAAVTAAGLLAAGAPGRPRDAAAVTAVRAPQLHVYGNKLFDRSGQRVVLHGVDRSGGEYACVQHDGIW